VDETFRGEIKKIMRSDNTYREREDNVPSLKRIGKVFFAVEDTRERSAGAPPAAVLSQRNRTFSQLGDYRHTGVEIDFHKGW